MPSGKNLQPIVTKSKVMLLKIEKQKPISAHIPSWTIHQLLKYSSRNTALEVISGILRYILMDRKIL